jgi:hypothetical protein
MGSKKRSPQHPASPAGGEVGAQAAGKATPVTAAPETAPVAVVPKPPDVAPFLTKVYDMVSDPATDAVISWSAGGGSFVIWDSHVFERDLLPRHFKHNHFTSFIRQLNTYVRITPSLMLYWMKLLLIVCMKLYACTEIVTYGISPMLFSLQAFFFPKLVHETCN